ncbi:uncharacterized protein SPPG_02803, partial [Spizellomyces punctatus DAOM BR117]
MRAGAEINNPMNGIYIYQGIHHNCFGLQWWMIYKDNRYRVVNLVKTELVQHDAVLKFHNPAPNPLLVNLHGMMGLIRFELAKAQLWKAAGERTDLFFPDDPLLSMSPSADTLEDIESPQGKQTDISFCDEPPLTI